MNEQLTVYTLPGCIQCTMTTRALDNVGLPYNVIDLTRDEQAAELVKRLGYTSAPVVIAGAMSWSGFRPDMIKTVAQTMSTTNGTPPRLPLITPRQTSDALGITLAELSDMRNTNTGPKFHHVGYGVVRYNTADVIRWQTMRTAS